MSEKQALEDGGETDENDGDEEIDKVNRKTVYFLLCSVPKLLDICNSCWIFMLLSAKIENNVKDIKFTRHKVSIQYEVKRMADYMEMKFLLTIFRRRPTCSTLASTRIPKMKDNKTDIKIMTIKFSTNNSKLKMILLLLLSSFTSLFPSILFD